jgi:hypothetical protein
MKRKGDGDGDDGVDVVASHAALSVVRPHACCAETLHAAWSNPTRGSSRPWHAQVAGWMGMSAEDALEEAGPCEDVFAKRPAWWVAGGRLGTGVPEFARVMRTWGRCLCVC